MSDPQKIAKHYIDTWNETNIDLRLNLLKSHWTSEASYIDPLAEAKGIDQLNALIGAVQDQFPGFRFTLKTTPSGYGAHVRLSWSLGPDGAEAPIEGSDVIVTAGDRVTRVIGFLDKIPQGA